MNNELQLSEEVQVPPEHYVQESYENKERFISYWHQINEIRSAVPDAVLEVGIGSGFVSRYLRDRGMDVTTVDIDEELHPDVVAPVHDLPFDDSAFSVTGCFEVLEHLPYEEFEPALRELRRVTRERVIVSLPDARKVYRFLLHVKHLFKLQLLIPRPRLRRPAHEFDGQHYWEIETSGFPLRRIVRDMEGSGFELLKTYRVFEHPYHRFFVLKVR